MKIYILDEAEPILGGDSFRITPHYFKSKEDAQRFLVKTNEVFKVVRKNGGSAPFRENQKMRTLDIEFEEKEFLEPKDIEKWRKIEENKDKYIIEVEYTYTTSTDIIRFEGKDPEKRFLKMVTKQRNKDKTAIKSICLTRDGVPTPPLALWAKDPKGKWENLILGRELRDKYNPYYVVKNTLNNRITLELPTLEDAEKTCVCELNQHPREAIVYSVDENGVRTPLTQTFGGKTMKYTVSVEILSPYKYNYFFMTDSLQEAERIMEYEYSEFMRKHPNAGTRCQEYIKNLLDIRILDEDFRLPSPLRDIRVADINGRLTVNHFHCAGFRRRDNFVYWGNLGYKEKHFFNTPKEAQDFYDKIGDKPNKTLFTDGKQDKDHI